MDSASLAAVWPVGAELSKACVGSVVLVHLLIKTYNIIPITCFSPAAYKSDKLLIISQHSEHFISTPIVLLKCPPKRWNTVFKTSQSFLLLPFLLPPLQHSSQLCHFKQAMKAFDRKPMTWHH